MEEQAATSHNDSLSDEDLEARMYSMVHYTTDSATDVTVPNVMGTNSTPEQNIVVGGQKSNEHNMSRYWKKDVPSTQNKNTTYNKVNVQKNNNDSRNLEDLSKTNTKDTDKTILTNTLIKAGTEENSLIDPIFQAPIKENAIITIELVPNDNKHVVTLESSDDDDDVIEVKLPPKPTICIESSDDEELLSVAAVPSPAATPLNTTAHDKAMVKSSSEKSKTKPTETCSSPVLSVVSSVSDDFIRSDCAALNISSRSQESYNFNFNLHGTDLVDETQNNSLINKSKKKKGKQKQKDKQADSNVTPNCDVPITNPPDRSTPQLESSIWKEYFARPKNKVASKKNEKSKSNIPISLVEDTEKILDVPEDQPVISKEVGDQPSSVESSLNEQCSVENIISLNSTTIDLTDKEEEDVEHNDLVIANVIGNSIPKTRSENNRSNVIEEFKNRKKIYKPLVLNLDVDFKFNPFGNNEKAAYNRDARVYTIESCVNDMEKFYNMSWGGEEFDHLKILKTLPRDKGLWRIDPSDRFYHNKRRNACHTCNRFGHKDKRCPLKKPKCHMCGLMGHWETRCPHKLCLNCGSKNHLYTSTCRNCLNWSKTYCNTCSNYGHPASRCPDQWRRYHLTVDNINKLTFSRMSQEKPRNNLHCSGCSQRGHILNHCRNVIPFNSYYPATPFIANYTGNPMYLQGHMKNIPPLIPGLNAATPRADKRKWEVSATNANYTGNPMNMQGQMNNIPPLILDLNMATPRADKRKWEVSATNASTSNVKHQANQTLSSVKEQNVNTPSKQVEENTETKHQAENTPEIVNFTPSNKNQKKAYVLQDNEVSNTDNAITNARMLLSKLYSIKLTSLTGQQFLKLEAVRLNIEYKIINTDFGDELSVKGTKQNQVEFQAVVRDWLDLPVRTASIHHRPPSNIPKKGAQIAVKLKKALQHLRLDLGDPREIYKEYKSFQKIPMHLRKGKYVAHKSLKHVTREFHNTVRDLNMILLGQAGLAEGPMHLNELYNLRDSLQGYNKKVTPDMRAKVAEHYNAIFSPVHRTDYELLVSKYYELRHDNSKRLQIYTAPGPKLGNGAMHRAAWSGARKQ